MKDNLWDFTRIRSPFSLPDNNVRRHFDVMVPQMDDRYYLYRSHWSGYSIPAHQGGLLKQEQSRKSEFVCCTPVSRSHDWQATKLQAIPWEFSSNRFWNGMLPNIGWSMQNLQFLTSKLVSSILLYTALFCALKRKNLEFHSGYAMRTSCAYLTPSGESVSLMVNMVPIDIFRKRVDISLTKDSTPYYRQLTWTKSFLG